MTPQQASELAVLNPEAIERVRTEAWPQASDADELHDALMLLGFVTEQEVEQMSSAGGGRDLIEELVRDNRATELLLSPTLANHSDSLDSDIEARRQPGAGERRFWVCAERLAMLQAVFPKAILKPLIEPVDIQRNWTREAALVELLRGRLEGLGPVTVASLTQDTGLDGGEITVALVALETEGFVMRGRFSTAENAEQWCERGLLARIHRYTIRHLRDQIKPVSRVDFMAFLLKWHGITATAEDRREGEQALMRTVEQLEGFHVPAAAWEGEILPSRLRDYRPSWLDQLCTSGRVMWLRLDAINSREEARRGATQGSGRSTTAQPMSFRAPRRAGPLRTTPIALIGRRHLSDWVAQMQGSPQGLSSPARLVFERLDRYGASFVDEIIADTGLLHTQVEEALAELVAFGLVSSDAFAGLRALLLPSHRRKPLTGRRRRGRSIQGVEDGGRWFRLEHHKAQDHESGQSRDLADLEHIARVLLQRYGVVFRALLRRETGIPAWRDLLYLYRRLEARGEVRGGRFVAGFSGEQFALPDAVGLLRKVHRETDAGTLTSISAADPLNLLGIVLPGERVPALTGNRILYRDGQAAAVRVGGKTRVLMDLGNQSEWEVQNALIRYA